MAQTITENRSSSGSPTQEFSDLAWRFNNLNSTAKMLLVGTSSQSVPFIPISELAYEPSALPQQNTPTSISSFAKPVQAEAPSVVVSKPSKTFPAPVPVQSPVSFPSEASEPVTFASQEDFETLTPVAAVKDEYAPFKPVFYSRTETEVTPEELPLTDLPERRAPEPSIIQPVEEPLRPREQRYFEERYQQAEAPEEYENVTPWGYNHGYDEVEERTILHNENIYEQKKGSFWGPFLKTTGVVSAVVLLGMGAMYLWNANKRPDVDTTDLDNLSPEVKEPTTVEKNISSSSSSSKTFFEEKTTDTTLAPEKAIKSTSPSTDEYYQPKVISKPPVKNKIKTSRPSVYTAPTSYQKRVSTGYPVYSTTTTSTSNSTYSTPEFTNYQKPAPLYDPTTIYDSAAESAIKPSTYTAEEFPIEISYTKESPQFEAAFVPPASTYSSAASTSTTPSTPAPTPVYSTTPSANNLTKEEAVVNDTPEGTPVERVNSNYPVENRMDSSSSSVKLGPAPVPLYSKPLSQTENEAESLEETSNQSSELESPVLREPVQSSSNDVFASPYKTTETPLTTSVVVQQKPPVKTGRRFFSRRKYANEYRREAAVNNANNAINTYQTRLRDIQRKTESNNLTESERLSLLREVEMLKKNIENTQVELDQNRNPLTRKASNSVLNDEKQLNNLEKEANRVYLKPNFEETEPEDSDLNISYLD